MANATDHSSYYVPHNGWYPIGIAAGAAAMVGGLGLWLNALKAGNEPSHALFIIGVLILSFVLFCWFAKVIEENQAGLANAQLKRSYVWGMSWFIFSEVMFFAAFFGALFYVRVIAVPDLGQIEQRLLWPDFQSTWPTAGPAFKQPFATMGPMGIPAINTLLLLTSGATVTWAHWGLKENKRGQLILGLVLTIVLGVVFLGFQGYEYYHAYHELNLKLSTGIFGSTFFMLTGFHGTHVTLGVIMLTVILLRSLRGHFTPDRHFAFEAVSWYWHFVDVVWLLLFVLVYWI